MVNWCDTCKEVAKTEDSRIVGGVIRHNCGRRIRHMTGFRKEGSRMRKEDASAVVKDADRVLLSSLIEKERKAVYDGDTTAWLKARQKMERLMKKRNVK